MIALSVTPPTDLQALAAWSQRLTAATERASAFLIVLQSFLRRESYDYRKLSGEPPSRQDGEFAKGPLRGRLIHGSEDEQRRGLLALDSTWVRPYTLMRLYKEPYFADRGAQIRLANVTCEDPVAFVTDRIIEQAVVGPLQRVFNVRGSFASPSDPTEAVVFAFPAGRHWDAEGNKKNCWLLWTRGARYGDESMYLLDGDLDAWARDHKREPRPGAADDVALFFDRSVPENDPAHPWKVIEYDVAQLGEVTLLGIDAALTHIRRATRPDGSLWLWGGS